jgi:Pentapeptide repeats (8 copies)
MLHLLCRGRWLIFGVMLAGMGWAPIAISTPFRIGLPKPITRPLTRPLPQPTAPVLTPSPIAEPNPLTVLADRNECPGCNLSAALLRYRYLPKANLAGAMLQRADLSFANLAGANLAGANLAGADLSFTDLTGANLTGADLSRAVLTETQLTGAILTQTTLADALMLHATIVLDSTLNLCRATLPDGQVSTQGCPPARGVATISKPTPSVGRSKSVVRP